MPTPEETEARLLAELEKANKRIEALEKNGEAPPESAKKLEAVEKKIENNIPGMSDAMGQEILKELKSLNEKLSDKTKSGSRKGWL